MSATSLTITEVRSGQVCIVALAGRIDSTNAEQFSAQVNKLFAAGEKNLVVDFKQVRSFIQETRYGFVVHGELTRLNNLGQAPSNAAARIGLSDRHAR